jgi:hypothetical protein
MLKKFGLAAVLLVAGAAPSFAEDTCQVPPVPAAVDGTTVSHDGMVAAIGAVKAYQTASDTYQTCITDYVAAQNAQADKDKKAHDPNMIQSEGDKGTANETSKEKAVNDLNTAIVAYKKAHPG